MTDFNNSIITKRRIPPFPFASEAHTIENSVVQLSEIPDGFQKVTVTGQSITWAEQVSGIPSENTYVVDYENNFITFHSSREGLQLQFNYYKTGLHYVPISMIYTQTSDGEVVETLQDVVFASGNASTVLSNLNSAISTGTSTNSTLSSTNSIATQTKTDLTSINSTALVTKTDLTSINSTALVTKTDLTVINSTATATKSDLGNLNTTSLATKVALDLSNSTAISTKSNLDSSISSANLSKTNLDSSNITASNTKVVLDLSNSNALETKTDLTNVNVASLVIKSDLNNLNTTAGNTKIALDSSISSANISKTNLDNSIISANSTKTDLNDMNIIAIATKNELESANVVASEATRIQNESLRLLNEENRVTTESSRVSAENIRKSSENLRIPAEASRISAESARIYAENLRIAQNNNTISAENIRIASENIRLDKEIIRQENENIREAQETNRQSTYSSSYVKFKGIVTGIASLPASGNILGDTYQVINDALTSNNAMWRYNGTIFEKSYVLDLTFAGGYGGNDSQVFTATANQTVFTLTEFPYLIGVNQLMVYVAGIKQIIGVNYTETSTNSFTLTSGVVAGTKVEAFRSVPGGAGSLTTQEVENARVSSLGIGYANLKARLDDHDSNKVGVLANLNTSVKTDIVSAINEQQAETATLVYVDNQIVASQRAIINYSGTLAELNVDIAADTEKNYLILDSSDTTNYGYACYYDSSTTAFVKGWQFQNLGLGDNSVAIRSLGTNIQEIILNGYEEATVTGAVVKLTDYLQNAKIDYNASSNVANIYTFGKNLIDTSLFDTVNVSKSNVGNTLSVTNNHAYSVSTSNIAYYAAGTYVLSCTETNASSISFRTSGGTYINGFTSGSNKHVSFVLATSGTYKINIEVPANTTAVTTDLQCEVGTTKTAFELFTSKLTYAKGDTVIANSTIMVDGDSVTVDYHTNTIVANETVDITNLQTNPLWEKIVLWNGDSIMKADASEANNHGWDYLISNANSMTSTNYAVSGRTIADNTAIGRTGVCDTISSMAVTADYIIFEGGVNDPTYTTIDRLGAITTGFTATLDETTFYGALESICKQAQIKWPTKKVGFIIPYKTGGTYESVPDYTPFYEATIAVLEKWSVPYLDLYKSSGINVFITEVQAALFCTEDLWHLKEAGYLATYNKVQEWMKSL